MRSVSEKLRAKRNSLQTSHNTYWTEALHMPPLR
nr:unnamed protein product [Callosobruchus chinensis]